MGADDLRPFLSGLFFGVAVIFVAFMGGYRYAGHPLEAYHIAAYALSALASAWFARRV